MTGEEVKSSKSMTMDKNITGQANKVMVWLMKYYPVRIRTWASSKRLTGRPFGISRRTGIRASSPNDRQHCKSCSAVGLHTSCFRVCQHLRQRRTSCATSIFRRGCANYHAINGYPHMQVSAGRLAVHEHRRTKRKHGRHKWQTMILISSKAKMCAL